nr:unnamed protein product [Callosobruchus analis]
MPVTCIVVGCGSRSERDRVSFFCIPIVCRRSLTNLSLKRRDSWIAAIKRQDLTESKLKYQRVCSKHFITAKPASLEDEHHPDWVPSQHMGHEATIVKKKEGDVERHMRLNRRREVTPTLTQVRTSGHYINSHRELVQL